MSREPVVVATLVGAVAVLVARFGLDLSQAEQDAITAIVVAFVALFARSRVTPV